MGSGRLDWKHAFVLSFVRYSLGGTGTAKLGYSMRPMIKCVRGCLIKLYTSECNAKLIFYTCPSIVIRNFIISTEYRFMDSLITSNVLNL
jgi:hypothetical protein